MAVRLEDLELVAALLRGASLSAASRLLGVDQSTASRRLAEAEARVGAPLFVRSKRGVHATELALRLAPMAAQAEQALQTARLAVERRAGGVEGTVRLATIESVADHVLVPALAPLLARHPGLVVELLPAQATVALTRREADLAVRLVKPEGSDLVARRLAELAWGAWGRPEVLARAGRPPYPPDRLVWVTWERSGPLTPDAKWLESVAPGRARVRSNRPATMLAAARAGLGVTLLPRTFGRFFEDLVEAPLTVPVPMQAALWLVAHRDLLKDPAVRAVFDWVKDLFAAPPARAPARGARARR